MGLDITAYSHLKHVGRHPGTLEWDAGENWCENEHHTCAFAYQGHEASVRGLLGMEQVGIVGQGFIGGDCYSYTEGTETMGFRAGSYGGYSRFRETLAEIVGLSVRDYWTGADPDLPFYEQVNFADNEGSIGPEAAKDLLEDFRAHRDAYMARHKDDGSYFAEVYDSWIEAYELASQDGMVSFH